MSAEDGYLNLEELHQLVVDRVGAVDPAPFVQVPEDAFLFHEGRVLDSAGDAVRHLLYTVDIVRSTPIDSHPRVRRVFEELYTDIRVTFAYHLGRETDEAANRKLAMSASRAICSTLAVEGPQLRRVRILERFIPSAPAPTDWMTVAVSVRFFHLEEI